MHTNHQDRLHGAQMDAVEKQTVVPDSVSDLIRAACQCICIRAPSIENIEARLDSLHARLTAGRLQLAVVGQFKRGKSTLLNALLGCNILPSAVTPLTAIPTFLRGGDRLELSTFYTDGRTEQQTVHDAAALGALLAEHVTEDANPRNCKGVARVDVQVDAPLLRAGIVLIDTPGIGSTFKHNTDTAKATLPECDMALFVVSPDPPVTEVELSYLREIRGISNDVVIILNKVDIVDAEDKVRSEKFLSDTVMEAIGPVLPWFFSVSARKALAARLAGDKEGLVASGLPALENYLLTFARTRCHQVLESAIAKKAALLVRELIFEVDTRLAALRMPIADLSDRLARFAATGEEFEKERRTCQDLLAGDKARLLSDLDARAAALAKSVRDRLMQHAQASLMEGRSEADMVAELEADISPLFQSEFDAFECAMRDLVTGLLHAHQQKSDSLIADVRRLAATLLDIPYTAPVAEDAFQAKKVPYWVTVPREAAFAMPNVIDTLLPVSIRLQRARERVKRYVDEIVTRNVENLRWALRQNIDTTFRTFQSRLDDQLRLSQEAARTAMEIGIRNRAAAQDGAQADLAQLTEARMRLSLIGKCLERFQDHG